MNIICTLFFGFIGKYIVFIVDQYMPYILTVYVGFKNENQTGKMKIRLIKI